MNEEDNSTIQMSTWESERQRLLKQLDAFRNWGEQQQAPSEGSFRAAETMARVADAVTLLRQDAAIELYSHVAKVLQKSVSHKYEKQANFVRLIEAVIDQCEGDRKNMAEWLTLLPVVQPEDFWDVSAVSIQEAVLQTRGNAKEIGLAVALGRLTQTLNFTDEEFKSAMKQAQKKAAPKQE